MIAIWRRRRLINATGSNIAHIQGLLRSTLARTGVRIVSVKAVGAADGGRYAGLNDAVAPVGRPPALSRIGLESAPLIGLALNENVAALPAGTATLL